MRTQLPRSLPVSMLLAAAALTSISAGQSRSGVIGLWREPGGSVLNVHRCGSDVCATLVYLPPNAPSRTDGRNPSAANRSRPLCGLEIGWGFHPGDANHASDGFVYDPRNGSTYHGSLSADAQQLRLRGYIGMKMFGRTETWTRIEQAPPPCAAS